MLASLVGARPMHYELRVIGNPIAHSKSPFIHAEFAKQAGLSVNYERTLAPLGGFAATVAELKAAGVYGCNVTLPFKEDAYALGSEHSERAKRAKAANTLVLKADGSVFADNTDGIGIVRDIQNNLGYSLVGKRVLICGAGGAVRGILYPIIDQHPASLVIANRSKDKAIALAREFFDVMPVTGLGYEDLADQEFDVVIDGTSFAPEPLPLPASLQLSANSLCYDLKYKKDADTDTAFLIWARSKGARLVHDGIGMLVEQAAESFKLWTGFMPDTKPVIHLMQGMFYAPKAPTL